MKNRIFAVATLAASMSLFTVPAMNAATLNLNVPVHAMDKVKMIKFDLRNDTANAVTIKAGDQQITVAAGKTSTLKLVAGTQVTTVNATANHQAGDVIATVDSDLSGNTLILN